MHEVARAESSAMKDHAGLLILLKYCQCGCSQQITQNTKIVQVLVR